ncbi:MAG: alpha/beta fold hydrolase [Verrucomicrobia bacterium]|nr:alpha/beta fold hydrolase [Verrucomicrobiota bacterium]
MLKRALVAFCLSLQTAYSADIAGHWSSDLEFGPIKIQVTVFLEQEPSLQGWFYCPEQGIYELPLDELSFDGDHLQFRLNNLDVAFQGDLRENQIDGHFTQSKIPFKLTFKPTDEKPAPIRRPQEPIGPFPYQIEEVAYRGPDGILSGTLTLPDSAGPHPAIILIAAAGPNDRDETLLGHKTFLVLADHLTRQGLAVLRFDKRGVKESEGDYHNATSFDFADDVLAGVDFLKTRSDIASIGLVGHSEGGLIAPIVASRSPDIAYIVMMAAPAVPGEEIIYEQLAYCEKLQGYSDALISADQELSHQLFAIVKQESDLLQAETKMRETIRSFLASLPAALKKELNDRYGEEAYWLHSEAGISQVKSPWFRSFLTYDPAEALRKVTVPVLALNGTLDFQVTTAQNLPAIAEALLEAGNPDVTIVPLPQHNHLFQTCVTGDFQEYGQLEETLSPTTLETITTWVLDRVQKD